MIKILVAGDFAPSARLAKQIETKNFGEIFPDNLVKIIKYIIASRSHGKLRN